MQMRYEKVGERAAKRDLINTQKTVDPTLQPSIAVGIFCHLHAFFYRNGLHTQRMYGKQFPKSRYSIINIWNEPVGE